MFSVSKMSLLFLLIYEHNYIKYHFPKTQIYFIPFNLFNDSGTRLSIYNIISFLQILSKNNSSYKRNIVPCLNFSNYYFKNSYLDYLWPVICSLIYMVCLKIMTKTLIIIYNSICTIAHYRYVP